MLVLRYVSTCAENSVTKCLKPTTLAGWPFSLVLAKSATLKLFPGSAQNVCEQLFFCTNDASTRLCTASQLSAEKSGDIQEFSFSRLWEAVSESLSIEDDSFSFLN